jgi:TetR/AcrR family transcriptional repressor of nem operon
MRYRSDHKSHTRDRIVAAASRGFRARGLERVGVADVMADAGLTHGGFYAHFPGKDALIAAACGRTLGDAVARFERMVQRDPDAALQALVDTYLAPGHRSRRADGCLVVALGSELARSSPAVRRTVARQIDAMLTRLSARMSGRTAAARRDVAGLFFASLIGTLLLSRLLPDRTGRRNLAFARRAVGRAVRIAGHRAS